MITLTNKELIRDNNTVNWSIRINEAIETARLCLFGQPIVRVAGCKDTASYPISGIEVLLRLTEPDGTLMDPTLFMSAMEKFHLAERIDRHVLKAVSHRLLHDASGLSSHQRIFINISGQSLNNPDFLTFTAQLLLEAPTIASRLCIEITETASISNLTSVQRFMHALKLLGCQFALDDFGSGFSSFTYLKALPVDYLKIDGSFVHGVADNPVDFAIVRSFSEIGQMMGKTVVAEWVETDAMVQRLRLIGIDWMQGHAFGRPVPLDELI